MIINLDGEKPENIPQELWEACQKMVNDTLNDESEVKENA